MPYSTRHLSRSALMGRAAAVFAALSLALSGNVRAGDVSTCYPDIDGNAVHYVIGYGSLMDTESKNRTWPLDGVNLPARVTGYQRAWNTVGTTIGFSTTFLGVTLQDDADMVAALYRVFDAADFAAGDEREFPYCRVEVAPSQITMIDGSTTPTDGRIWIYVVRPDHIRAPDADYPIVQSYVDIFLNGCIEMESRVAVDGIDFVTECITTTAGWSPHWVNDREYPRRPFDIPNAFRIDELLNRELPEEFAAIQIE